MSLITATPTPRTLLAIRSRDWSVWQALFELVDNSFGEQRGNATEVWISWNPKERLLTILDNGQGMEDVSDLFILGKGAIAGTGDIGFFGVGGSEAGLWLSDKEHVQTLRDGAVATVTVNWRRCVDNGRFPVFANDWRPATPKTCRADLLEQGHGTYIALLLRDGLRISPDKLQMHLARTFAAALRSGRKIHWIQIDDAVETVTTLTPWDPGELLDVIEGTVTIAKGLSASIRAGRVENLSIANSKLSVNYLYRQIKESTDGFGRPIQGACGYIDLSPEWLSHLTTTKDNFREESRELEDQLMAAIATLLQPLIAALEDAKLEKIFNNVKFTLETKLNAGISKIRRSQKGYGPGSNPTPRPPGSNPRGEAPASAIVKIVKSPDHEVRGVLCRVELNRQAAVGYVNQDHELIKEALKTEPVNQRLLEQVLIQPLAAEIVRQDALVHFGLFSEEDAQRLLEEFNGNAFEVVLHLIRKLTDGVVRSEQPDPVAV